MLDWNLLPEVQSTLSHYRCVSCSDMAKYAVKSIVVPYPKNFYTASNLEDLFHNIHPERIMSFIHAIGLANKV